MEQGVFTSRLSYRLLKSVLLFSGIVTVLMTCTQMYFTYQERKETLLYFLHELEEAHTESLAKSAFELNEYSLKITVADIIKYDAIGFINVDRTEENDIAAGSPSGSQLSFVHKFPLIFNFEGRAFKLGSVEIHTDANYFFEQLQSSFYVVLATQAIKTFLVSFILLLLFYRLIISRINTVHRWLVSYAPENAFRPLSLPASVNKHDEIDELKNEINLVGESLHKHHQELELLVSQRTQELAEANLKLEKLAYTDHLTGIANRAAFFRKSEEELRRSRRLNYDLGVMMLDLDHFKAINDTFGHDAGDQVLKLVAQSIEDCLREQDTVGRLGGEEFGVIVPGADKWGMQKLAIRIQETLSTQDFSFLPENHPITVSIGYTKLEHSEQFNTALKRADEHLYAAKANGRNCYVTDSSYIPTLAK